MEASFYASPSAFFTLTYSPQWLPSGGVLSPQDLEVFRYKLRHAIGPYRYFFVGEYGSRNLRPHYHGVIFGKFPHSDVLWDAWDRKCDRNRVQVGELLVDGAGYVAGYVTKKLTHKKDPRLAGMPLEFTRMSRRPGIGYPAVQGIADWLRSSAGQNYLSREGDVPKSIRFQNRVFPLGRYIVEKIRLVAGVDIRDPRLQLARAINETAKRKARDTPEGREVREYKRENAARRAEWHATYDHLKRKL